MLFEHKKHESLLKDLCRFQFKISYVFIVCILYAYLIFIYMGIFSRIQKVWIPNKQINKKDCLNFKDNTKYLYLIQFIILIYFKT